MGMNEPDERLEKFREWMEEKELSESTIESYTYAARLFFENYRELTKGNLISYKRMLMEKHSPKTANIRCIAMNQYCEFEGRRDLVLKNVKIHKATTVENVISVEEYRSLVSRLQEDGDEKGYFLVKFLAKTGARVSEIIRFRKQDLEKGYCEMWTKGKVRRIYIPDSLKEESEEYFAGVKGELLFPNRQGKMMSTRGVAERIKSMGIRYGINGKVMHPHSFRHLYAIEFLKRNRNVALLADLMGHESVDTTAIYLRLSEEEQRKQLNEAASW